MKNLLFFLTVNSPSEKHLASFEGADLLAIETLPITDARLKTAWDHDLYRIRLKGNDAGFRLTIQ